MSKRDYDENYIPEIRPYYSLNDLVSVVIPVYNSEKFLKESIESVLSQTYSPLEIIAINDGSTDNSLEILNQFKDKITIIHQKNQGLAAALNTGVKKMTGKWFKWFSPDDILYPYAIEILVRKANDLGGGYIVYSNWEIIDENNNHLRNFSESNYNDLDKFDFNVRLLDGQQINMNTILVPSWLFKKGCMFQELKDPVVVDYDFFLRAGILFGVGFHLIPKVLIKYRIHTNQLSHKTISNSLSYQTKVRDNIISQLDDSQQNSYQTALNQYNKTKSISKKTMEIGLKFMKKTFPEEITDKILIYYLNKIRRSR